MNKLTTTLVAVLALGASNLVNAAEYQLDIKGAHAFINFKASHLGYSWLTGRFNKFDGKFSYDADNLSDTKIEVTIDPSSIDSNHAERDKHLRGKDFLHVSKFPESRRDLALIVDEQTAYESLRQTAVEHAGEYLRDVTLFDVYQGQGIEAGRKSLALGLTWQHPSRTLNDDEINGAVDSVITALKEKFGASLRE